MEQIMKWWKNKSYSYWLRVVHRDLGFLMVGVCLIYGISGMLLNHMNGKDPSFHTTEATLNWAPDMSDTELEQTWDATQGLPTLKRVIRADEENIRLMLDGGVGMYNTVSGTVDYEVHKKRPVIYWFNRLHYNRVEGWNLMGDFFAVSLIFFALSGMWMVKGKHGLKGRGKWYLLIGILIPIAYILLS